MRASSPKGDLEENFREGELTLEKGRRKETLGKRGHRVV